jgi:hypothetical protein
LLPSRNGGGRRFLRAVLILSASAIPGSAFGAVPYEPYRPTISHYGGAGLLDTRTARFMPDGFLVTSVSVKRPDDRIALTFQALPWAEATFRYSVNDAVKLGGFTGDFYDRSFDLKFRLWRESEYLPEVALGFQDVVGTGVYSAEYVVGSKALGPLDFSLGFGWGRFATSGALNNPFRAFGDRFNTREDVSSIAGKPLVGTLFRGQDMGVFGGIEYRTPIRNLRMQVEYTSDRYAIETRNGGIDYSFPLNVGLNYRALSWLNVGVSYMHGRSVGVQIWSALDLAAENHVFRLDPPPRFRGRDNEVVNTLMRRYAESADSNDPSRTRFVDLTAGADPQPAAPAPGPLTPLPNRLEMEPLTRLQSALALQGIAYFGHVIDGRRIRVAVENDRFRRDADALARTARVLSYTVPDEIEEFEITVMRLGQPLTTVLMPRTQIDALASRQGSPAELWVSSIFEPAETPEYLENVLYPRVGYNLFPYSRQSIFDPDNPLYAEFGIGGALGMEIMRGLWVNGNGYARLVDNYPGDDWRRSDSVLPHVRTDFSHYLEEGAYSIGLLEANYFFKLQPEIYARVGAGYLEWMFGGVGGEVLYEPFGQRWAIGGNLWWVKQRDYNQLFGFRDYQTITGHLSAYYDTPYYDYRLSVHAGRYLAGDYGATFEAVRHFPTGVRVGGWFTLTNVSAERFGEGSFDKGIRIVIPFEWLLPIGMQNTYALELRPVQRDGGAMLLGAQRLKGMVDEAGLGPLSTHWSSVFRP